MTRGVVYFYSDRVPDGRFLAELQMEKDGVFSAIVQNDDKEEWLSAKEAAALLASLGIKLDFKGIYRWADDGFIRDFRPQPHTRRFGKSSIKRLASRLKADPEYWQKLRASHYSGDRSRCGVRG
ncbi:hypothetical protein GC207_03605 [bacterium]|nr:hypothetical protein [bacterium]